MADEQRPLSKAVPLLIATIVCDIAVADPSTGKKNLIGIFDHVNVARFPTARSVSVYFKLTDAEGFYQLAVRFVERHSSQIIAEAKGELMAPDRLASIDAYISFPPLPIPKEGRYAFEIFANEVFLGGTFIDAVKTGSMSEEKQ